jgi:hypothetical protein
VNASRGKNANTVSVAEMTISASNAIYSTTEMSASMVGVSEMIISSTKTIVKVMKAMVDSTKTVGLMTEMIIICSEEDPIACGNDLRRFKDQGIHDANHHLGSEQDDHCPTDRAARETTSAPWQPMRQSDRKRTIFACYGRSSDVCGLILGLAAINFPKTQGPQQ